MKIIKIIGIIALAVMLLNGCWESSTGNGDNGDEKDKGETTSPQESERITVSADSVIAEMIAAGDGADTFGMMDYMEEVEALYRKAAVANPANSRANFGAGLFAFQRIMDHPDMELLRETLESWEADIENLDYSKCYLTQYFLHGESEFCVNDRWGSWDE